MPYFHSIISFLIVTWDIYLTNPRIVFLIEVYLIHNIVLVTGVQESNLIIYIFFSDFSILDYYKILNIVPCVVE